MILEILIIVFAIAFSALFSATEAALLGFSRPILHRQKELATAKLVLRMAEHQERAIAGILIGNNLVNILASALATRLFLDAFGDIGVVWATLTMTLVILIAAEIVPKTIAIAHPERTILLLAAPITVWLAALSPVLWIMRKRRPNISPEHTEEALRGSIDLHRGDIHEGKMLHSVLDLDTAVVEDVMTHRSNVVMLDRDMPLEDVLKIVEQSSFTRYPVYQNTTDNVVGVVHLRDLLFGRRTNGAASAAHTPKTAASSASWPASWADGVLTAPWFVPETTVLRDQLLQFRTRRQHFALVVDEYGGLQGVVTLEAIIEIIVGEIDDEHDVASAPVIKEGDSYLVPGDTTLRALRRDYDWGLDDEEAVTIAGLLIRRSRIVPEVGRSFFIGTYRLEVAERDGFRLSSIRVTPSLAPAR